MPDKHTHHGTESPEYVIEASLSDGTGDALSVHRAEEAKLDMALGDSHFESIELADENSINIAHLKPAEDIKLEVNGLKGASRINAMMALKGHADFSFSNGEQTVLMPGQGCSFHYIDEVANFLIPGGQEILTFGVILTPESLVNYLGDDITPVLEDLLDSKQAHKMIPFTVSHDMLTAIDAAINPGLIGSLRRLQIEGAALIFIAYMAQAIDDHYSISNRSLNAVEQRAARDAYNRLCTNIQDPPHMSDLATQANLSERRLNQAFKELYGGTVFEIARIKRLEMARTMIKDGQGPLKQIAHQVGYNHTSNFATAFAAQFGISPGAYAKQFKT